MTIIENEILVAEKTLTVLDMDIKVRVVLFTFVFPSHLFIRRSCNKTPNSETFFKGSCEGSAITQAVRLCLTAKPARNTFTNAWFCFGYGVSGRQLALVLMVCNCTEENSCRSHSLSRAHMSILCTGVFRQLLYHLKECSLFRITHILWL